MEIGKGYFHRVAQQSDTRFWINNPTVEEAQKAIQAGAIACTTNPTYSAKMLQSETERQEAIKVIDEVIREIDDDYEAARVVQRKLVKRILGYFMPIFESSGGKAGFVSIQGDPLAEHDSECIIKEAVEDMKLGKNVIAKIPVTAAGLKAIEAVLREGIPVIATEVMSISQAVCACELYMKVCKQTNSYPPFYVTHITGIFDEYLKNVVEREKIQISKDILWQAGCIVARKQYRLLKEKGYPVTMLGGGVRGTHHFTEMVGGDMHITINWKGTADRLLEEDPPVVYRMYTPIPDYAVDELMSKIPDFKKAYLEDGLAVEEFMDYGPVKFFRDSFIEGWNYLLNVIRQRRSRTIAEEQKDE